MSPDYIHEEKGFFGRKQKKYYSSLEVGDRVVTTITIFWGSYEAPIAKGQMGVVLDIGFEEPWHKFLGVLVNFNTYQDRQGNSQVWVPESALRKIE